MKIQYLNINSTSMVFLERDVNNFINKGFLPIGGVTFIKVGDIYVFNQTVFCDNPDNENLDESLFFDSELNLKLRKLKKEGKVLEAVKLAKDTLGVDLNDAKDFVDSL